MSLLPVAAHMKLLLDAPEGELSQSSYDGKANKSVILFSRSPCLSESRFPLASCQGCQGIIVWVARGNEWCEHRQSLSWS